MGICGSVGGSDSRGLRTICSHTAPKKHRYLYFGATVVSVTAAAATTSLVVSPPFTRAELQFADVPHQLRISANNAIIPTL